MVHRQVPLITHLSLVMRNEHSVCRRYLGHWLVIYALSRAVFPTFAICLGFLLALIMVGLTNGCLSEITLSTAPQQRQQSGVKQPRCG